MSVHSHALQIILVLPCSDYNLLRVLVAVRHKSRWWSNRRLSYKQQVRNSITVHLLVRCAAVCLSVFLVEATQWNVSRQIQQILQICYHHVKLSRGLTLVRPYPEYGNTLIIQSACKPTDFTQCLCTWEGRLGKDFWSTLNHIVKNICCWVTLCLLTQGRLIQQL